MLATSGKSVPNVGPAIREPQCGGREVDEESRWVTFHSSYPASAN
jgi:hypothetical protein